MCYDKSMHFDDAQCKHFDRTQCRQKGFAPVLVLVGIVVIVAGIYLKLANSDFENCKRMSDSRILESYPLGCQTPDGKIFHEKDWRTLLLLMKKSEPISQTPQPTSVQCQTCAGSWDTTCPGNFTCVVPDGYSQGVCRPVPKIGQKYTIDQINNACGTNFSDKTTKN